MPVVRKGVGNNANTSLGGPGSGGCSVTLVTSFLSDQPLPSFHFLGLGLGRVPLPVTRRVQKSIGSLQTKPLESC